MALRLVDIYLPNNEETLPDIGEKHETLGRWDVALRGERCLVRVLIDTKRTEPFLDWLHDRIQSEEYRVVVSSVEAVLPRPSVIEPEEVPPDKIEQIDEKVISRISREELRQDLETAIGGTKIYHMLVALSTIVAAGGMLRDSVAVVIGAMVIAPLIGPNIALAFATTVGDANLLKRSFQVNVMGLLLGLVLAVLTGFIFLVDPLTPQIANRLVVHWSDIFLALAAGVAGVLSFTRGVSTALIGVMVAVALLPPLVAVGLMLGSGYWYAAYSASLLMLTNVVCVNLAAVVTFLMQGIRPLDWREEEKAKENTRRAILLWAVLLILLVLAMLLVREPSFG